MIETLGRVLDVWTKRVGLIALIGGARWSVFTYVSTRATEAENTRITAARDSQAAKRESQKPFLEKRLESYAEAATVTATVARSKDAKKVAQAKDRFWTLYWGPLAVVEDSGVKDAMVEFGKCLNEPSKCSQPLVFLSLAVAHQCKRSIAEEWGVAPPPELSLSVQ